MHLEDPRVELEEHYDRAAHTKLLDLGLLPFLLGDEFRDDLVSIARGHVDRLERSALEPRISWRSTSSTLSQRAEPQAEGSSSGRLR